METFISIFSISLMEIALAVDNVIFVSIIMSKLPEDKKPLARKIWMAGGMFIRVLLLLGVGWLVKNGNSTLFSFMGGDITLKSLIMLVGGIFLIYKTVSEIHDKLEGDEHLSEHKPGQSGGTFGAIMAQIFLVDLVFSLDSIIAAVGMGRETWIMITAVLLAMVVMFSSANKIASFIQEHPTFKMLALAFLLLIGFTLTFEGFEPFHHSHIPKGYIYFAMLFALSVEVLNLFAKQRKSKPVKLHDPKMNKI